MVIGAEDSDDASFIASRISNEVSEPKSITVFGIEMNICFVGDEKVNS